VQFKTEVRGENRVVAHDGSIEGVYLPGSEPFEEVPYASISDMSASLAIMLMVLMMGATSCSIVQLSGRRRMTRPA
jgi:hypothetical protein